MSENHGDAIDRPDPENNPFACSTCGVLLSTTERIRDADHCDACLRDVSHDDLCTAFGRPVAQESENGDRVELRTHSETILLGDDDALELADEIGRIVEGHETNTEETDT